MTFMTLFVYCVSFVFGWNFFTNVMVSPSPTKSDGKIHLVTVWLKLLTEVLITKKAGGNEQVVMYLRHSSS
jgi:hypothetical protein